MSRVRASSSCRRAAPTARPRCRRPRAPRRTGCPGWPGTRDRSSRAGCARGPTTRTTRSRSTTGRPTPGDGTGRRTARGPTRQASLRCEVRASCTSGELVDRGHVAIGEHAHRRAHERGVARRLVEAVGERGFGCDRARVEGVAERAPTVSRSLTAWPSKVVSCLRSASSWPGPNASTARRYLSKRAMPFARVAANGSARVRAPRCRAGRRVRCRTPTPTIRLPRRRRSAPAPRYPRPRPATRRAHACATCCR